MALHRRPAARGAARIFRRVPLQPARHRPGVEYQSRPAGALALLTIVAGLLPAGVAFIGAQIVDAWWRRATCRGWARRACCAWC